MDGQVLKLVIIEDDASTTMKLIDYLHSSYGKTINITAFDHVENAIEMIDKQTDLIIIDTAEDADKVRNLEKTVKEINPYTQIIKFSSQEHLGDSIEIYLKTGSDIKADTTNPRLRIASSINRIFLFPVHFIVKNFNVSKFLAMLFMTFLTVAVVVIILLIFIF